MNGQAGGFSNPVFGGNVLIRPAVKSPNYQPGVQGWQIARDGSAEFNNLTLRGTFVGTDWIENASGLFIYDGTPAAGNLISSIAPTSGTDQFGNAYLAGVVSYFSGEYVALSGGNLLMGLVTDGFTKASTVGIVGVDGIVISSPFTATKPATSAIELLDGDSTLTNQGAAGYPHLQVDGTVWLDRPAIQAVNNANTWTPETWHTPTFSGTWSSTGTLNGNSTFRGMQYRKDAEDNVWVLGGATTTGAGGSIFTLPSGYFNASKRALLPCFIFHSSTSAVSSGFAQVTETGVVNIAASLAGVTIAAGDQVFINGKFPLGNVA